MSISIPFPHKLRAPLLAQIVKFLVTGGISFIADFSVLILLVELCGLNYLAGTIIAYCVGVTVNFLLSVYWVFNASSKSKARMYISFFILSFIALLINSGIVYLGVEALQLHYTICKIIATIVVTFFNFVTRKILIETSKFRLPFLSSACSGQL